MKQDKFKVILAENGGLVLYQDQRLSFGSDNSLYADIGKYVVECAREESDFTEIEINIRPVKLFSDDDR